MSSIMRKPTISYAKTKALISCAVTAQLISAFVFAIRIVQYLLFLNTKFQASSHLLWLYRLVCVRCVRKPRRLRFSHSDSFHIMHFRYDKADNRTEREQWAVKELSILVTMGDQSSSWQPDILQFLFLHSFFNVKKPSNDVPHVSIGLKLFH